jgi:hypothetical protein
MKRRRVMKAKKPTRIYHPYWDWECYKAGFYNTTVDMSDEEAKVLYKTFLGNLPVFGAGMTKVMKEWPISCEHFLTNPSINRIAWLGQASMCITTGVPSRFKGGFKLLSSADQEAANNLAQEYLTRWENENCKS